MYKNAIGYANIKSQRNRMRDLFARSVEVIPELQPHQKRFVAELVDTRNFYTHLGERTDTVIDGFELRRQLDRLVLVLRINYLLDLGFGVEATRTVIRRAYQGGYRTGILGGPE